MKPSEVAIEPAVGDTERLRRRGLRFAWFIVVWDVIEGAVAVTAGIVAGSIALVGFGIDSMIEVFAASIVIWQLRGGDKLGGWRRALRAQQRSITEPM